VDPDVVERFGCMRSCALTCPHMSIHLIMPSSPLRCGKLQNTLQHELHAVDAVGQLIRKSCQQVFIAIGPLNGNLCSSCSRNQIVEEQIKKLSDSSDDRLKSTW